MKNDDLHPTPTDWFLPGINPGETLESGLKSVISQEQDKLNLVQALFRSLCAQRGTSADSISELRRQIQQLAKTLDYRLPLLSPDRRGAWFRDNAGVGHGPVSDVTLLPLPVFPLFEAAAIPQLRKALMDSWQERSLLPLPVADERPSLWGMLLALNHQWRIQAQLEVAGSSYSLLTLPSHLPPAILTPALRIFLHHVKSALLAAQQDLDGCHQRLWKASTTLFGAMMRDASRQRSSEWDGHSTPQDAYAAYQRHADDIRSRFRERRGAGAYAHPETQALSFLGFQQRPGADALRKRYREMARQFHPDSPQGNEESFKELNRHYHFLLERLPEV